MKLYCPITIDLYRVYPLQVMEAQQGNVGRGAIVTLTAGSAVIDPTDETVEVYAKKPDGTVSWLECSVEDAKVKIDFTNQMLMSIGVLQVELRIKNEDDDITTPIFKVKVNKSNVQSAGRSENELPLLDQIKKNAEDAKTAAEAAETAVGNKVTNPAIGAVGQILEIETVDDEGKPLTYKAVDKPETVDKELSQIVHASKYGIVSDGFSDTVIVIGKDAAAGDVIKYVIKENSGDITVIYDNNDTGEFNITTIDHAGEAAGEKTLTAEKYCTYTFPSEMDVYLPFNIPAKTSQLTDDVGFAKQEEVGKLSEDIATKASAIKEKSSGEVIVVTDSDEAKPLGLAIDGKSEQNQYSGKNLYPYGDLSGNGGLLTEKPLVLPVGTYTFSMKTNVSSDIITTIGFLDENKKGVINIGLANSHWYSSRNSITINITSESKYISVYAREEITLSQIQIESGSEMTDLEPYCGGKPSPNTEYKQEIRNIGVYDEASGKYAVEVKCTGKNLLDCSGLVEKNVGGITYTPVYDENGLLEYIEANGTATSDSSYYGITSAIDNTFMDTILNGCPSGGTNNTYRLYCDYVDENGKWIESIDEYGNGVALSKTHSKVSFKIYIRNGQTANKLRFYPMVRPVGTDDTYEPYKETTATVYLDEPLRKGDKAYWNGGKLRIGRYIGVATENDFTEIQAFNTFGRFVIDTLPPLDVTKPLKCTKFKGVNFDGRSNYTIYPENGRNVWTCSFKTDSAENSITNATINDIKENIIIEYTLAEPITEEIDIDLGELSMFYPTTILSNDCNANMEVTYIADTKAYIDKKFAELATAMV